MGGARGGGRGDPRGHPRHCHRTTHRQNVSNPKMLGRGGGGMSLKLCADFASWKAINLSG